MRNNLALLLLCSVCFVANANAETFVVTSDDSAHPASLQLPSAAVVNMSSNVIEYLEGEDNSQPRSMCLIGDVTISVQGVKEPIVIKTDRIVLTLVESAATDSSQMGYQEVTFSREVRFENPNSPKTVLLSGDVTIRGNTHYGPFHIRADKVVRTIDAPR